MYTRTFSSSRSSTTNIKNSILLHLCDALLIILVTSQIAHFVKLYMERDRSFVSLQCSRPYTVYTCEVCMYIFAMAHSHIMPPPASHLIPISIKSMQEFVAPHGTCDSSLSLSLRFSLPLPFGTDMDTICGSHLFTKINLFSIHYCSLSLVSYARVRGMRG